MYFLTIVFILMKYWRYNLRYFSTFPTTSLSSSIIELTGEIVTARGEERSQATTGTEEEELLCTKLPLLFSGAYRTVA